MSSDVVSNNIIYGQNVAETAVSVKSLVDTSMAGIDMIARAAAQSPWCLLALQVRTTASWDTCRSGVFHAALAYFGPANTTYQAICCCIQHYSSGMKSILSKTDNMKSDEIHNEDIEPVVKSVSLRKTNVLLSQPRLTLPQKSPKGLFALVLIDGDCQPVCSPPSFPPFVTYNTELTNGIVP